MNTSQNNLPVSGSIFRGALLAAAVTLAVYIPYKYATQLHAIEGLYAFLFPLSGVLALAGIVVAVKPRSSCSCGMPFRAGVGAVSALWLATGLMCVGTLADGVAANAVQGSIAVFHMVLQHVFLSLSLLAFSFFPKQMVAWLGLSIPGASEAAPTGESPAY